MKYAIKVKLISIVAIVLLLAIISAISRLDDICPQELNAKSQGIPIIKKQNSSTLYSGIKQIVSDDNYVYVVFGSYGAIQVYDLAGNYQYSIAVFSQQNGRIRIAVENEMLYIRDKADNIYVFLNGELLKYLDKTAATSILDTVDFNLNSSNYEVRLGSIWNISSNSEAYCFVQRPFWLAIHQNGLSTLLMMALLLMLAGILFLKKHK